MSAQKRGREVSPATRAAIAYARYQDRSPLRVIQARTGVSLTSISNISNDACKQAKIHGTEPFRGENVAPGSRSGRPPLLCQEQIDIMIKLATSSYEWRRRSWVTVARECGVIASRPTIEKAFKEAGYGRYSPRQKPYLTVIMKTKRLDWCRDKEFWDVISGQGWGRVIYTDETSVKLGELRNLIHVTRTKEEEWEPDCCKKAFSGYTTFMFWGSIALDWKGPCYIYQPENKKDREASISALAAEDLLRRPIEQAAHAEKKADCLQQGLKAPSFRFSPCCRSKRGGIDWYRYNRCVLRPLLLPAYHRFQAIHCPMSTTLLMQDGASCHTSQWQKPLFAKQNIVILNWPDNSFDLNPIEHVWNLLKNRVANRRPFIKGRAELEHAWMDEWDKLDIEKDINPFILNQKHRVAQVIVKQGGNNFHG